ncbi:hypothetical protein MMC28_001127 [Mycoblastus sanguinarius]|nr:hypothetical protein [Mycoblastus sanguinarius]
MACTFVGNSDVFGTGIRIGYYAQALAVWFSNYFLYREAKALRAVNNLFLLALIIVGFIYFAHPQKTFVIEAFLMLQIGLVIGLVGITEVSRYSSKYIKTSKERLMLRIVIIIAGSLFNVCFWWKGLEVMLPTPCQGANVMSVSGTQELKNQRRGTFIFYLFKANIYGWAGTLMKIKSLIAAVYTAPKIVTFDAVVLIYDLRMKSAREAFVKAVDVSRPSRDLVARPKEHQLQDQRSRTAEEESDQGSAQRQPAAVGLVPITSHPRNAREHEEIAAAPSDDRTKSHQDLVSQDLTLLKDVERAEKYIEELFSMYPANTATLGKRRLIRLCRGWISFYIPRHKSQCTDRSPYLQCLRRTLIAQFNNKPPMDLKWRLALHTTASGQHPPWRFPRLVNRMHQLSQSSEPPDWHHFAIASDILLTRIPFVISTRTWILMAAWNLAFIGALILQVELTIVWNNITGLQSVSSLGQLIPFILGVGGLIKVFWAKWRLVREGAREDPEFGFTHSGEYEEAMVKYLERKKPRVDRPAVRAATA